MNRWVERRNAESKPGIPSKVHWFITQRMLYARSKIPRQPLDIL